ncbi:MAG: hypothetical protein Q4P78_02390 [Rothia sp. (in: high G+C Gram-positive bacteria)]|uniref:hypothetical protein n=1 Tax=Rothia sp. (in: high G+C Gram-positive bacteria) TaxID=1885016 RepID=UPI0026DFFBB1|nr:hypothetical protein [Rothia sp. (in: high G+C Gram-positive bacteria)]MDO5750036.1 hypothetical protein [Rothia sp. (in: high G+C Gram-positive bacteria)]
MLPSFDQWKTDFMARTGSAPGEQDIKAALGVEFTFQSGANSLAASAQAPSYTPVPPAPAAEETTILDETQIIDSLPAPATATAMPAPNSVPAPNSIPAPTAIQPAVASAAPAAQTAPESIEAERAPKPAAFVPAPSTGGTDSTYPRRERTEKRRSPLLGVIAALLVVLIAMLGGFFAFQQLGFGQQQNTAASASAQASVQGSSSAVPSASTRASSTTPSVSASATSTSASITPSASASPSTASAANSKSWVTVRELRSENRAPENKSTDTSPVGAGTFCGTGPSSLGDKDSKIYIMKAQTGISCSEAQSIFSNYAYSSSNRDMKGYTCEANNAENTRRFGYSHVCSKDGYALVLTSVPFLSGTPQTNFKTTTFSTANGATVCVFNNASADITCQSHLNSSPSGWDGQRGNPVAQVSLGTGSSVSSNATLMASDSSSVLSGANGEKLYAGETITLYNVSCKATSDSTVQCSSAYNAFVIGPDGVIAQS